MARFVQRPGESKKDFEARKAASIEASRAKRNGGAPQSNGKASAASTKAPVDPATDPVSLQILALYVVQQLGQGTLDQIASEMAVKLKLIVNVHTLEIALDALRKRGFLSANHGADPSGSRVDLWSIRNLKFQSPPEVAHYGAVLSELLKTPEAQQIKAGLDAKEHKGEKKEKANRLGYRDYYTVRARFVTMDAILGAMPKSPYLSHLLRLSEKEIGVRPPEADIYFDRDPIDGRFAISSDQVAGWVRTNMRYANKGDISIYVGCSAAKFQPKPAQVEQAVFPIITQGKGAGLAKYEAVKAGVEFEIIFTVPAFGAMAVQEFRAWLAFAGMHPIRGISPARGKRYGKILLIDFEATKDVRDVQHSLKLAMTNIAAPLREKYEKVLEGHLDAAKGVFLWSRTQTVSTTEEDTDA